MTTHDDENNDRLIAAMFELLKDPVPPPDEQFRRDLREQSIHVFAAASSRRHDKSNQGRRFHMVRYATRGGAAAAAAGILVLIGLLVFTGPAVAEPTLGTVLETFGDAESARMTIQREDAQAEAVFRRGGLLRETAEDGTYLVARGDQAWLVDEQANTARPRASRYFTSETGKLDALALLGLHDAQGLQEALAQTPRRLRVGNADRLVYESWVHTPRGRVRIHATADPATRMLLSLETHADRDGRLHPLATLTVLAVGEPVQEELFVVGSHLTEDGRAGKVVDSQGIVSLKPAMARRWTPVGTGMLVRPGDWVQTDVRGANAATIRLVPAGEIVVGPGSLAELVSARVLRVHYGEVRVSGDAPLELQGPDGAKIAVERRGVYRVVDRALVRIEADPQWLRSYEGQTAEHSIGSLVANVDGRNTPLTVGYHKVTVDIRDQIARTVVEQSFVNHTDGRLEGVFYFPLPQDASISGFGMWIGNELVEADVVERQRAREIYEQILRERRDPGLLEWSGGNLFTASIFPIEPHSEKRIRITYTQVLPMSGGGYRYSYALQSELLRQHPLRELQIDVHVHSALPIRGISCPTHPARIARSTGAARVEFTAQEYTPTQDFEVAVEVDAAATPVVLVPHRRGDDGYFLLMVTPPDGDGGWRRDVLPEPAEPQELLIVADTSASMSARQRAIQAGFIATLLASAGPEDTFNLAVCDVNTQWVFDGSRRVDPQSVRAARDFLESRISLGWTDLDQAFASAIAKAGPGTRVIYVGDGIPATVDADAVAFARRLRRMHEGKAGTFYAVSVGSTYESGVLKAIASLGGGSVRQVDDSSKVRQAVMDLMGEFARPPIRDLRVQFTGLRTARVYPEELTNLPGGVQQILLGRYLPTGSDQGGEVIVTGMQNGRPVRLAAAVSLADDEAGNSFIPRLWARMHLDYLLQQGSSQAIRDEIIALSEEYHIITPYTSLLVLETDADRERFRVTRRFRMRDGERFFADGRSDGDFELMQQQMALAGTWRLGLRRSVLQQFATLGRDAQVFQMGWLQRTAGGGYERLGRDLLRVGQAVRQPTRSDHLGDASEMKVELDGGDYAEVAASEDRELAEGADFAEPNAPSMAPAPMQPASQPAPLDARADGRANAAGPWSGRGQPSGWAGEGLEFARRRSAAEGYVSVHWLNTLFPALPAAQPLREAPGESDWPQEAKAISDALLRREQIARMSGLVVRRSSEGFDAVTGRLTSQSNVLTLLSSDAWLIRSGGDAQATSVQWSDGARRAIFQKAFMLGRTRQAVADDLANPPVSFGIHAWTSLEQSYRSYDVRVEEAPGGHFVRLVLTSRGNISLQSTFEIDTQRWVVLSLESHRDGVLTGIQRYSEPVEVGGAWWPTRYEVLDAEGKLLRRTVETFAGADAQEFQRLMAAELADVPTVQFLAEPARLVIDARRAVLAGSADFDDQITLMMAAVQIQQWDRTMEHLQAAEELAGDKPGMGFLRDAMLLASRRHEELKGRLLSRSAALAGAEASPEELVVAEHILNQAQQVLEANEILGMLDELKPLFDRQAEHVAAPRRWTQRRIDQLQRLSRNDDALVLMEQLVTQYPNDVQALLQYAQGLVNTGRIEDAFELLRAAMAREDWPDYSQESLHARYADMLQNQGRWEELVEFTAAWMARELPHTNAYLRHLGALIRVDRIDDADAVMTRWIEQARAAQQPDAATIGRLQAAVAQARGQGHGMWTQWVEEQWLQPLAEVTMFLALSPWQAQLSDQIMSDWRFSRTDEAREVRRWALQTLLARSAELTPEQIQRLVNWALANDPAVEADQWRALAGELKPLWQEAQDAGERHTLGQALARVLGRLEPEELLAFLRQQLEEGPELHRAAYAMQLFEALTTQPFNPAYEDEAFALLQQVSQDEHPARRLLAAVRALHTLSDRMVSARYTATMKAIPNQEDLTRTELMAAQTDALQQSRRELADRLDLERRKDVGDLAAWLAAEWLHFDILAGGDQSAAAAEAWELLGPVPAADPEGEAVEIPEQALLRDAMRNRMLVMLGSLATRRNADAALAERLGEYLDAAIIARPLEEQWKLMQYQLLVALDRPQQLQQALETWIAVEDPDYRWTASLGYLLAEQGKLEQAVAIFAPLAAEEALGGAELRTLANWYQALGRREQYDRAMIQAYMMVDEWQLHNMVYQQLNPWRRGGDDKPPAELDPQTLLMFRALFEKSGNPGHQLHLVREFYQATRDFRLLTGLADSMVGHTAGRAYPFLRSMGRVLEEVRDEATVDEIIARIETVRQRATTDVDRRALDLLETLVSRRAAEMINQPGPHGQRALAALQRAFRHEWSPGEPRLMAELLAEMGRIAYQPLAAEQVRQLQVLYDRATGGSEDRLYIAQALAQAHWHYERQMQAIDLLSSALDEFQAARGGILPVSANGPLGTLVSWLETRGHFTRGEDVLLGQLRRPANRQQALWLTLRLYELYDRAIRDDGTVSLGRGAELYGRLHRRIQDEMDTDDQNHAQGLVNRLLSVYRTAHGRRIDGVGDDLRTFAFDRFPEVLARQTNQYASLVGSVANTLRDIVGHRDAVVFLIERIEQEPAWLRWNNQDGWSAHSWRLGNSFQALGRRIEPDIEERLLRIVIHELQRDLRTRQSRSRNMYHRYSSHYWQEKRDEFIAAAMDVYRQRRNSGAAVAYIAEYLWIGVDDKDLALEILWTAYEEERLDEGGQWQMVQYMHHEGVQRFAASVPVLEAMIEWRPDDIRYRVALMHAYFRTGRHEDLMALLERTDAHFHAAGRWGEGPLAALAASTLQNELYEHAVGYYGELIPLHQRTQPNRGIGNGTLSQYYGQQGRAYAGLGRMVEAVEAASAAVVAWGRNNSNRSQALHALQQVVAQARNLDALVVDMDRQAQETGLHNALARKAIGQVYLQQRQYDKAIEQLRLAVELQPNDMETHQALIRAYDGRQDPAGAITQLLASLQLVRREFALYEDLGNRYRAMEKPDEAERAYTSIVEVLPHDGTSHAALAEIRQRHDQWDQAVLHWQRVAELRSLEPTGLLKLAEAQLRARQWDGFAESIRALRSRPWPERFGNVETQARDLERRMEQLRQQTRP